MMNTKFRDILNKNRLKLSIILLSAVNLTQAQEISGIVYEDVNGNEVFDKGDRPLRNVVVTNQLDATLTDNNGMFHLKLIDENFISVTKPEGYQFALDNFNKPKSFYYYQAKAVQESLKYPGTKVSGDLPKSLNFPMHKVNEGSHRALLVGDPQMADDQRLSYFKDGILPFMTLEEADFRVVLGDIADDYLDVLSKELEFSSKTGQVGYYVFGNHDINYKAKDNRYATATFKATYGPEYYSFDYGNFHYVVLNTIQYDGWNFKKGKRGSYFGGIDAEQLTWLQNDMKYVSPEKTVVVCTHAPILERFTKREAVESIFNILGKNNKVFAVAGHLHTVMAYDMEETSHKHIDGLVAGATCGAWWTSPKDELDIPYATSTDGAPKGYFVMDVNGDDYDYKYKPVNYPGNFHMRIYQEEDSLLVNWFVGKKGDQVKGYIKSLNMEIEFTNVTRKDPFIEATMANKKNDDSWTPGVSETHHLWQAKIPQELKKGHYGLQIEAINYTGKKFKGFKIITIE